MVKIAVAQIGVFDELEKNVHKVVLHIERAAKKSADIVCFPESCLGEELLDVGCKEILQIRETCKNNSIYAIVGAHILETGLSYNVALLIDRAGDIQFIYKKVHLYPELDLETTTAGTTNKVIETDFGKIGIIICWDFAFQENIKKLAQGGAQIIFCPSYLLDEANISKEVFRSVPLTRAFENLCYFVTCDAYTDEVLAESYICSPKKILNKIKNREGIIYSELNLSQISRLRNTYDCLK